MNSANFASLLLFFDRSAEEFPQSRNGSEFLRLEILDSYQIASHLFLND